jgi:hypothetical protein
MTQLTLQHNRSLKAAVNEPWLRNDESAAVGLKYCWRLRPVEHNEIDEMALMIW